MTNDKEAIAEAEQVAHEAKDRLVSSFLTVRDRLAPQSLASEAAESLRNRALRIAETSLDKAKSRPATVVGVSAAAILVLFRKPIFGAMRRMMKEKKDGG